MNTQTHQHIIDSHSAIIYCLNTNKINNLLHLIKSIDFKTEVEERLNMQGFRIKGNIEKSNTQGISLMLYFKNNNKDYMHMSIHLCFTNNNVKQEPELKGITHFSQNISRKKKAYILVETYIPQGKPNSLIFKLVGQPPQSQYIFSKEQDAKVVLNILNEYFDEANPKFLNSYILPKHRNLNLTLQNTNKSIINRRNKRKGYNNINTTRKNKRQAPNENSLS